MSMNSSGRPSGSMHPPVTMDRDTSAAFPPPTPTSPSLTRQQSNSNPMSPSTGVLGRLGSVQGLNVDTPSRQAVSDGPSSKPPSPQPLAKVHTASSRLIPTQGPSISSNPVHRRTLSDAPSANSGNSGTSSRPESPKCSRDLPTAKSPSCSYRTLPTPARFFPAGSTDSSPAITSSQCGPSPPPVSVLPPPQLAEPSPQMRSALTDSPASGYPRDQPTMPPPLPPPPAGHCLYPKPPTPSFPPVVSYPAVSHQETVNAVPASAHESGHVPAVPPDPSPTLAPDFAPPSISEATLDPKFMIPGMGALTKVTASLPKAVLLYYTVASCSFWMVCLHVYMPMILVATRVYLTGCPFCHPTHRMYLH